MAGGEAHVGEGEIMTDVLTIRPLTAPPRDVTFRVPGSKSITNRVLLLAALADGDSLIEHALFSDDTNHMQAALRALGVGVTSDPAAATISVAGCGGRFEQPATPLFTGNAGTAARFLLAAVCLGRGRFTVDGSERMRQRPIADLISALRQLGATLTSPTGCPPVVVEADGLPGGHAQVSGARSSQYLSALLMVAPYAQSPVVIEVVDDLIAKPYVDMTIGVMEHFGVTVERDGYRRFAVPGRQHYHAQARYAVEADASSAHYFLAAAALTGGRVRVDGIGTASLQGDARFVDVLERMGAKVERQAHCLSVEGPPQLDGIDVDMNAISDTAPTLAVLAPFARSPVRIRNVAHLRLQESERVAAVTTELRRLGAAVIEHDDGWEIAPSTLHGGTVETYDDHRLAMAFALVGLRVGDVAIANPQCVAKTFPNYFEQLARLQK